MYCTKCGKHNPETSKFCRHCGASFIEKATSTGSEAYTSNLSPYIGFWKRFLAYTVDSCILLVFNMILVLLMIAMLHGAAKSAGFLTFLFTGGMFFFWVIIFCLSSVYFLYFWVKKSGQTLGDRLLAIQVVREDRRPITLSTGILRYLGYGLSGMFLCLGFLWVAWDEKKQGWHDKIAKTVVVKAHRKSYVWVAVAILIVEIFLIIIYNIILNIFVFSIFASAINNSSLNVSPTPDLLNSTQNGQSVYYTPTPILPSTQQDNGQTNNMGTNNTFAGKKCDETGTLVINTSEEIQNDIDHSDESNSYWALDNYIRHVQVWTTGTDNYCAEVNQEGSFVGEAGQRSPGGTGILTGNEKGTFQANQRMYITGTLKVNPKWPTSGTLPTLDYNCNVEGYCTGAVSWLNVYFDNNSATTDWSKWVYTNGSNVWMDSTDGNSGDVIQ